jgi:hypothetical protein
MKMDRKISHYKEQKEEEEKTLFAVNKRNN